jgi:hypothetical protein
MKYKHLRMGDGALRWFNENWFEHEGWAFPVSDQSKVWNDDTFVHLECSLDRKIFNANNKKFFQHKVRCHFCGEALPPILMAEKINRIVK